MSANPNYPSTPKNPVAQIQNSDATAFVTLYTAPATGAKIEGLSITSDDTADVVLQLAVTISAVDYVIGEITIPDGSGTNGTDKAVNGLNVTNLPWLPTDGVNRYLHLASGSALRVRANTTVTAGKKVQLVAQAGDY
jgi:hypothetical protein